MKVKMSHWEWVVFLRTLNDCLRGIRVKKYEEEVGYSKIKLLNWEDKLTNIRESWIQGNKSIKSIRGFDEKGISYLQGINQEDQIYSNKKRTFLLVGEFKIEELEMQYDVIDFVRIKL